MDEVEIRRKLELRRDELNERIDRLKSHIEHKSGPVSADFEEQAVERSNDDVVYGLEENSRNEFVQVQQALARLDAGQYGTCTVCGEAIAEARITAVPYSSTCINCAE